MRKLSNKLYLIMGKWAISNLMRKMRNAVGGDQNKKSRDT